MTQPLSRLAIVTATADQVRMTPYQLSWIRGSRTPISVYVVINGEPPVEGAPVVYDLDRWTGTEVMGATRYYYRSADYLGVVPAFALGVQKALEDGMEIIACLHDDLEIQYVGWDQVVRNHFRAEPSCGLAGFGGGVGLGDDLIYQIPYNPMQLARKGFRSNMRDAEAHGERTDQAQRVACLDGFSQIGRAAFWRGEHPFKAEASVPDNLFAEMARWGIRHHAYDAALGCWAKRLGGWDVWLLPIPCHHHGGLTAVADGRYHAWARAQTTDGDQGFWLQAHEIVYTEFIRVLPIRV